jgi:hypothetical protein
MYLGARGLDTRVSAIRLDTRVSAIGLDTRVFSPKIMMKYPALELECPYLLEQNIDKKLPPFFYHINIFRIPTQFMSAAKVNTNPIHASC